MSWYERMTVRIASTRPGAWFFVNVATRIDRVLVPLTGGRLSSCLGTRYHRRHLLLTTTGVKSGHPPVEVHPGYATDRVRAGGREIPVVVLSP